MPLVTPGLLPVFAQAFPAKVLIKVDLPTAAAIEEGRKMMKDPSAPRYSSMDALKAALDV